MTREILNQIGYKRNNCHSILIPNPSCSQDSTCLEHIRAPVLILNMHLTGRIADGRGRCRAVRASPASGRRELDRILEGSQIILYSLFGKSCAQGIAIIFLKMICGFTKNINPIFHNYWAWSYPLRHNPNWQVRKYQQILHSKLLDPFYTNP